MAASTSRSPCQRRRNHPLEQLPQDVRHQPLNKLRRHPISIPQDHTKRNDFLLALVHDIRAHQQERPSAVSALLK